MQRHESWIERARSSLELAKYKAPINVYYEDLCYQAQQAAEKVFKGLLIFYGVEPDFTHDIGRLLNEIEKKVPVPEEIKQATGLTSYAVQTRYPGEYEEITKAEYEESIRIAEECVNWVSKIIQTPNDRPQ